MPTDAAADPASAECKDGGGEVEAGGGGDGGVVKAKYTLLQAVGFNTMNMFGTGPLITIPYCLASVSPAGPHAMVGYGVACAACVCDSLVWGEIGSMWPESGGSYVYLRELYGPGRWGRFASFMFIWQFFVSGPAEVASGCIAVAEYLTYFSPSVLDYWPRVGISLAALAMCAALLFRRVEDVGRAALALWGVTLCAIAYTLAAGFSDWDAARLSAPPGALRGGASAVLGVAAATRFGVYDMTGYYDVCFMGGEVANPKRTIPISCAATCAVVACIYILVYLAVLGHLPWQSFIDQYADDYPGVSPGIMSVFTESRFGTSMASVVTVVVAVTILGSTFSMLCGFGYLPYAAARDGAFFSVFAHESQRCPGLADYSLLSVVLLSAAWCFFDLELVIDAMTAMIVLVQFVGQSAGLLWYRHRTPAEQQPQGWRMPLYPLPCIIQIVIFLAIWVTSDSVLLWGSEQPILELSVAFLFLGAGLFVVRARCLREWPFAAAEADAAPAAGAPAAPDAGAGAAPGAPPLPPHPPRGVEGDPMASAP